MRLTTIAALSTTILAGGAVSVFAEEARQVTTEGQIRFVADEDGELEIVPPVTEPDVTIPPEVPGTTGPLSIVKAPTMNFGSQVISNQDQTYNMVAEMAELTNPETDGPKEVPYVSFAQVQDVRGTNAGWDLKVSLSDFEAPTAQNKILTGAQITLVNPQLRYEGSNTDNAPTVHDAGLTLLPDGSARPVMTAAQGEGAGASSVVWGDQADLTAQFEAAEFDPETDVVENEAIQLSIPGSTAKDATTYTSTLTWELTTTPGEDGPGETNPETNA
ncbi:WxL domain-containing protein [Enterococcus sp. DIV0765f]|uniref:WxL domain-containing protein n=1 Tax=Enterococcus sp. DIV0765f TaxID=2774783 RepID=UPI003F682990